MYDSEENRQRRARERQERERELEREANKRREQEAKDRERQKEFEQKRAAEFAAFHGVPHQDNPAVSAEANQKARDAANTINNIKDYYNNLNSNNPSSDYLGSPSPNDSINHGSERYTGSLSSSGSSDNEDASDRVVFVAIGVVFIVCVFIFFGSIDSRIVSGWFDGVIDIVIWLGVRCLYIAIPAAILFFCYKMFSNKKTRRTLSGWEYPISKLIATAQIALNPNFQRLDKVSKKRLSSFLIDLQKFDKSTPSKRAKYLALKNRFDTVVDKFNQKARGNNYTYITRDLDDFLGQHYSWRSR